MRKAHSDEGEMLEWLKRHAWKACKLQKGFGGSNPPLSAKIFKTTCLSLLKHGGGKIFALDARGRQWVFEVAERSEVGVLESSQGRDLVQACLREGERERIARMPVADLGIT